MQYVNVVDNLVKGDPPKVKYYNNSSILILKPDFFMDFKDITNNCYNVSIIINDNAPSLIIDGKAYNLGKKSMITINPGQIVECHPEATKLSSNPGSKEYISIFIDNEFIDNLSYEIYGKSRAIFNNTVTTFSKSLFTLTKAFTCEHTSRQSGYNFVLDSIASQIAIDIFRNTANNLRNANFDKKYKARKEISRVIDYMHQNFAENISLEGLCNIANLSPFYFIKIFKYETGKTPCEYFINIKLEKAKQYLKQRNYSISEIAYMLGFSSQSYFSAQFRNKAGCSPLEYQKKISL